MAREKNIKTKSKRFKVRLGCSGTFVAHRVISFKVRLGCSDTFVAHRFISFKEGRLLKCSRKSKFFMASFKMCARVLLGKGRL